MAQGPTPAAALPLIDRMLAAAPRHADVLTVAGLAAQRLGNLPLALERFAAARSVDPDNPARLGNHAVALKQAGRYDEAIAALHRALELRPGAPITLANLGSCLIAAGRAGDAVAPLRNAVSLKPDHAEAWNNLGIALARSGNADSADTAYLTAVRHRPGYVEALLNRADLLVRGDRIDEAEAIAREVLATHKGHPRAANQLASLHDRRGDLDRAIALYREALDSDGLNHPIGVNLAMALLRVGDNPAALALCDRLLDASPSITTPLALKCAALDRIGDAAALNTLMSLDRFTAMIDIEEAPGFETMDEFHRALERDLAAHPSLTFEPEGLVARTGHQSGDLAEDTSPAFAALAHIARTELARHMDRVGDGVHPWLRARPSEWSLTLWGTMLSPGGAVEAHIHAPNWLSGVYYPAFAQDGGDGHEGWFAIGALPQALGGGGTLHVRQPKAGRMILFPSYLWHATLPFTGTNRRISFAFDLVPEGIGRRHSLDATMA
ncbi:2OG-Fe(II) oxygenase family protein [Sphingosinicella soli]|uniref:Flp pilus assembly protein TadD n=1 Tax=Sphingosinicella soli TaxID=333708 RepID=A0A7W7F5S1_9SPHN|nr:tetratricopeptide repeat protein [Sphingosinicella soli]MBB4630832.1 Flp pilus assembly protein TadD [Sphingosinicella soli]